MSENELQPEWTVRVVLDGDDWAPTATGNVRAALDAALADIVAKGFCLDFSIEGPEGE
jgi:hypothetical protein